MNVTIDPNSGFCFGVVYAIQMAEDELDRGGKLFCLGDIVHNNMEVDRLKAKGLEIIDHERLKTLRDCKVLIRAHGEPPDTYRTALQNNIELIDASCPVVLKLQHRVKTSFEDVLNEGGQIVIYGQPGHAEVNGLVGQTDGKAIVVFSEEDLANIDFMKPVHFFSQTTKSTAGFEKMERLIQERIVATKGSIEEGDFVSNDTLCRQVSNREPHMRRFSLTHDIVIFVSGKKSSNGKALFTVCKETNPDSYFISNDEELEESWFEGKTNVGICGATSTPMWLMDKVAEKIRLIGKEAVSAI
jgi:4-hydroxy-3-methylbut-2-enyl diphosphate reductase